MKAVGVKVLKNKLREYRLTVAAKAIGIPIAAL